MSEPLSAGGAPIPVDVESGKTYWWCACGRSSRQPFCDGSHKDTGLAPAAWTATKSGRVFFCACKRTSNAPMCDGSHNRPGA